MILLTLLALGANAWTAANHPSTVIEIKQQWQETETVCASGSTSCTKAVDTTTPYNQIISGRAWGEIVWKVEVSVKRNDAGGAHKVTVTVPAAQSFPNAGQNLVKECDATASYTTCIGEVWPVIAPRATVTFTFTKLAGVAVTVKIKVTGINTGRTIVDNASWSRNLLGKTYNYQGWPNWNRARLECAAQKTSGPTTGVEMCLTSEHSDLERDVVTGLIWTKGWPGAWIGQTEGVGLGRWLDTNSLAWKWSDGSDSSYIAPWTITPKAGTVYEGINTAEINAITEGKMRANRILSFAGSEYLAVSHCGAQLLNKEWSGMKCRYRWPAICAPCMHGGSKRLEKTSVCEECRLPVNPEEPLGPNNPKRCYSAAYCNQAREAHVFPTEEDVTDWGKIVGTTLGIVLPLTCFAYCCCYKGKGGGEMLDDEE